MNRLPDELACSVQCDAGHEPVPSWRSTMSDFVLVLVTIAFFAVACAYAVACDRL